MAKSLIGVSIDKIETVMIKDNQFYHEQYPNAFDGDEEIVTAEFIAAAKKNGRIKGKDCALILPEGCSYYRTFNCPIMNGQQIKMNLPFEFKNYIGSEVGQYNYDYFVDKVIQDEQGNNTGLKLIAAAGKKEVIENYVKVLKNAGMNLKVALPKEVCLINLMRKTADPNKEYCFIDITYEHTNVYLFKGSDLVATKEIDIGNKDIDAKIAEDCGVEKFTAAKYRNENYDYCLADAKLAGLYMRIATEIVKTINFYRYEHNDSELDTAYFVGLAANNEALIKVICEEIDFKQGNIDDVLPEKYRGKEQAARYFSNIALLV